ncbi:MAG: ABC transporter, partial [Gammaproteobacteria bacterium]|nr:ABC transporter [Gammaproteobacteria bacterium]
MNPIIEYRDVSFSYGQATVLQDINLTIGAEEFFALIGPNAGGKSTLLKLLLGVLTPDRGSITVFGRPPSAMHTRIGYVPQFPTYRRDFPISVGDVVLMGRLGISSKYGAYSRRDRDAARAALST